MKFNIRKDNGTAGLTVLLSVVTMIFVIGLLVMIFALMGGELGDSDILYSAKTGSNANETLTTVDSTGENLAVVNLRNVVCTVTDVLNASDGASINADNYTQTNCNLANATATFGGFDWNVSYTYTYDEDSGGASVINDTTTSLSGTSDWFPLFIVITAMVVLILLTVIIISAIRSSGLMEGGNTGGKNNVGTA